MVNGTSQFQKYLLYCGLLITPLLSYIEVSALLTSFDDVTAITSGEIVLFKLAKDVILILLIVVGLWQGHFHRTVSTGGLAVFIVSIGASILLSSTKVPIESIAAGLRWVMPLIVLFFLAQFDKNFYIRCAFILESLLALGLGLQIYEMFNMDLFYGESQSGLSLRNPGFYLLPSSMASFAMVTLLFSTLFDPSKLRKRTIYALTTLSIILTASGTGLISLGLFTFVSFVSRRSLGLLPIIGIFGLFLLLIMLPQYSQRDEIWSSLMGRAEILGANIDFSSLLFSDRFGAGTNTFATLRPDLFDRSHAVIADSMINSSIINVGLVFPMVFVFEFFIRPLRSSGKDFRYFLAVFVPFYSATVLFELFPANILMFVLGAYFLRNSNVYAGAR